MDEQRFWVCDEPPDHRPFGDDTDGIVDETRGGIVLYVHRDNTKAVLAALRATERQPIGYIVVRDFRSQVPSILADLAPDNGGAVYVHPAAEARLADLRRIYRDDPSYRIAAVVPVEPEGGSHG